MVGDICLKDFSDLPELENKTLYIITIYKDTIENPHTKFLARLWKVKNATQIATPYIVIDNCLKSLRSKIPNGFVKIDRSWNDLPQIVESWI